jgi:hypothetical protein
MSVSFTCALFGICLVHETCILRRHGGELYFVDDWVCTRKLVAVNLKILDFNSSTFKIMECPGKQQAFWLLVHKTCTKHILMLRLHAFFISFSAVGEQNCRERWI